MILSRAKGFMKVEVIYYLVNVLLDILVEGNRIVSDRIISSYWIFFSQGYIAFWTASIIF